MKNIIIALILLISSCTPSTDSSAIYYKQKSEELISTPLEKQQDPKKDTFYFYQEVGSLEIIAERFYTYQSVHDFYLYNTSTYSEQDRMFIVKKLSTESIDLQKDLTTFVLSYKPHELIKTPSIYKLHLLTWKDSSTISFELISEGCDLYDSRIYFKDITTQYNYENSNRGKISGNTN